jgi:hypothetical protein
MTIKSNTDRLIAALEQVDDSHMLNRDKDYFAVDGYYEYEALNGAIDTHLAPLSSIITVGNPRAMYLRTVWADGTTDDGREFEVSQVGVNLVITIGTMEDGDEREVYEIRLHDLMPAFLRTVGAVK